MNATSQYGFHPDADRLNAFAERALEERERTEVLAHLAVCSRCRKVVELAGEAAEAEIVNAAAQSRKAGATHPWRRGWRMAWVPVAAVAATAVFTVYLQVHKAERSAEMAKLEPQNVAPSAKVTASPSHEKHAEPAPLPSPKPAPPAPAAKHLDFSAGEQHNTQKLHSRAAPGASEPNAADGLEAIPAAPALSHTEMQQAPPELGTGSAAGFDSSQPAAAAWEAKQKQDEQQRQAEADTARRRLFTARTRPEVGSVHGANQPSPQNTTQTVAVAAAEPMITTSAPPFEAEVSPRPQPKKWKTPTLVRPIHLPSGLAVVSSTSAGSFVLALDDAGTLFLSENQGVTWERVNKQWTGRAVEVTQQLAVKPFEVNSELPSAPAAQTETPTNTPSNTSAAFGPSLIFELSNDKKQSWVSTDGRTWMSK